MKIRSRRRERGAAVFVVVLVITLLTSIGVFAVKSASLSNRTSGYNRQLTQTHYITDLAVVATVADLKNSLHEAHHILENRPPKAGQTQCEAMAADLDGDTQADQKHPKCMLLSTADLTALSLVPLVEPSGAGNHGSLGPGGLQARTWVEVTDPYATAPPAGYQMAGGAEDTQQLVYSIITVSVTGLVQPQGALDDVSATSAGYERQRARVRMGPISAQK